MGSPEHDDDVDETIDGENFRDDTTIVVSAAQDATVVAEVAAPPVFRCLDSDDPARIVLHQVNPREFELVEGFRYQGRAGTQTVLPEDLPNTDLASIPRLLGWFANSYGTHTLAALLHDHLVRNGTRLDPPVARHRADDVFRTALGELGVPYLRSLIMWSAVVLATRWKSSLAARLAMAAWMAAALAGIATLAWTLAARHPLLVVPLLAPVPFALLWSRREFAAGVIGGYTLWFITLPTVINFVAYGAYWIIEVTVFRPLWRIWPGGPRRPRSPPSYSQR